MFELESSWITRTSRTVTVRGFFVINAVRFPNGAFVFIRSGEYSLWPFEECVRFALVPVSEREYHTDMRHSVIEHTRLHHIPAVKRMYWGAADTKHSA